MKHRKLSPLSDTRSSDHAYLWDAEIGFAPHRAMAPFLPISLNFSAGRASARALPPILYDRKYPDPDFKMGAYHREAAEGVSQYISNGAVDTDPIDTISVRPEIVLRYTKKNKRYIGAIKLHFSKTHPHNDESAGYVSAALNEFCKTHLRADDEIVDPVLCQVIDVAAKSVFKGVKSTKQRLSDIAASCQNIAALWPSI